MSEKSVTLTRHDAVAHVALNRPDSLNAFNREMRAQLRDTMAEVSKNADIRAVVLSGSGRAFCSGADLAEGVSGIDTTVEDVILQEFFPSLRAIVEMPKPVIAAVTGAAAGIGASYAMACDLSIMGKNAYLMSPFAHIGLVPDGGASWLMLRQMGHMRAYEAAIEGHKISAAECLQYGLTNKLVDDDAVIESALSWAASLCQKAPLALARTKEILRDITNENYAEAVATEARIQTHLVATDDCQEGINAFLEKRQPAFKGR